jgi:hypothetical protein
MKYLSELTESQYRLYRDTVDTWGQELQLNLAIEECSELIQAICKWKRSINPQLAGEIFEEMADVYVMLEQLRVIFDNDEYLDNEIDIKLDRLKRRLKNG